MFFGSYEYNIDEKGRLVVPSKFRVEAGEKLYLIKGFEGCVSLYTEESFKKFVSQIQNLKYEKKTNRSYMRLLLSSVVELTIDKQGRMLLPVKTLKEYNIGSKVILLGQIDHIEVWDLDSWNSYKEEHDESFELDAESILSDNEE